MPYYYIRLAGRIIQPFNDWHLTIRAVANYHITLVEPVRQPDGTYQLVYTGFPRQNLKWDSTGTNIRGASLAEAQRLIADLAPVEFDYRPARNTAGGAMDERHDDTN